MTKINFRVYGWYEPSIFPLLGRLLEQVGSEDTVAVIESSEGTQPAWIKTLKEFQRVYPRLQVISTEFRDWQVLYTFAISTVPEGEWMMALDADEWISKGFVQAIREGIDANAETDILSVLRCYPAEADLLKGDEYVRANCHTLAAPYNHTPNRQNRLLKRGAVYFKGARHVSAYGTKVKNLDAPDAILIHPCEMRDKKMFYSRYSRLFVRPTSALHDMGIYNEVYAGRCYRTPHKFKPTDVVVDIGAHVGCFSVQALEAGAGRVIAVEADPANAAHFRHTTEAWDKEVCLVEAAAWRSDVCPATLLFSAFDKTNPKANTGGGTIWSKGIEVKAVAFDTLLSDVAEVAFLKLDCEGSEFPILYTSKQLGKVNRIALEWHTHDRPWSAEFGCTPKALASYLSQLGFEVKIVTDIDRNLGLIFAARWGFKFWESSKGEGVAWHCIQDLETARELILSGYKNDGKFPADTFADAPKGGSWLDFGCGCGRNLGVLKSLCDKLSAYDYPNMIKLVSEELAASVTFIMYPLENIVDSYDVIHASLVLQHYPETDLRNALAFLAKRLNAGGKLHVQGRGHLDNGVNIWKIVAEFFQPVTPVDAEDSTIRHQSVYYAPL